MVSVGYHSSEGTAFDFDAYKRQCRAIAEAYRAWSVGDMSDLEYEGVLGKSGMVAARSVAKIEREVIVKGDRFRPIDAYQF